MNAHRRSARILVLAVLALANLTVLAQSADNPTPSKGVPSKRQASLRERGRYLVMLGGCNDCHTPGLAQSGGKTPESEWLTGDSVGWRGPWGTTYPPNLRLFMETMSEDSWVQYAHAASGRPPMPFWALNTMTEQDLRAVYQFVKGLGPKGLRAPVGLSPGEEPKTPFILFVPQAPK